MSRATELVQRSAWQVVIPDAPQALGLAGGRVFIAGCEGTALAVDSGTGQTVGSQQVEGGLLGIAPSGDGSKAILAGPFGSWLWTIDGGDVVELAGKSWCSVARWANEQRFALATGRYVSVFDQTGELLWKSEQFPSTVTDFSWLGSYRRLAVASYGGVHLVEPRPGGSSTLMPFRGSLLALASTPNGRWIVSGNQDATLQVFRSDKDVRLEMEGYPSKISRVAFDSTGRFLANDGAPEVSVWDFRGKGPSGTAPVLLVPSDRSGDPEIGSFSWHPSKPLIAVGWDDGDCLIYRPTDGVHGKPLGALDQVFAADSSVEALHWGHDGRSIFVAESSGLISRCDVIADEAA